MKVINSFVLVSALLMGSLSTHADEPYPEGLPVPGKAQNENTVSPHASSGKMSGGMHEMMSGKSADQSRAMMQACMEMMQKSDSDRTPRSDS